MVLRPRTGGAIRVSCWVTVVALVVLAVWPVVDAAPAVKRTKQQQPKYFGQVDAMEFLKKYGYLSEGGSSAKGTTGALLTEDAFVDAIKAYQAFSGLPVTGNLDEATVRLMQSPRCGVKDIDPEEPTQGRQKRYALEGSKWWKHALTYRISLPPSPPPTPSPSGGGGGGGLGSWLGSWLGLGGGGRGSAVKTVSRSGKAMEAAAAQAAVERALGVWAERSGLTFDHVPSEEGGDGGALVDLDVRFERGAHGHCDDFDGRGGTLAHAYYPRFGGAAHFDADEHWTLGEYRGTNFFQVAVHEFGHSLGLRHSDSPDAVMSPMYRGYDPYFELHQDDIDAIQDLYGSPTHSRIQQHREDDEAQGKEDEDEENDHGKGSEEEEEEEKNKGQEDKGEDGNDGKDEGGKEERNDESKEESEETEEDDGEEDDGVKTEATPKNELCDNPSVDAMFNTPNGDIYVLKGSWYYRLGAGGGVLAGYPRPLAERWPGLPARVDAALASAAGSTYFFKGALYWRYDDDEDGGAGGSQRLAPGFPRSIAQGLPGAPDAPDAALLRPADGRLYLFKGAEFWRYERSKNSAAGGSFVPRPLSQWKGVPSGLDAAFFHNGYTYFFKDGLYYRFDDVAFKVDDGSPPFPRSSATWWFGCGSTAQGHQLTDK